MEIHKNICDKCGAEVKLKPLGLGYGWFYSPKGWTNLGKNKDLCKKCAKEYKKHIKKHKFI